VGSVVKAIIKHFNISAAYNGLVNGEINQTIPKNKIEPTFDSI
jgi:hypothetical protein